MTTSDSERTEQQSQTDEQTSIQSVTDKLAQLEKVVRGAGRDTLNVMTAQNEMNALVKTMLTRVDDLEMTVKGATQSSWRVVQDSAGQIAKAEDHYAGALRDLEARITEELRMGLYRAAMSSMLPALDDLDMIIDNSKHMQNGDRADGLLDAVGLTRTRLVEGLAMLGLQEIVVEAGATRFDPTLHNAVPIDIPAEFVGGDNLSPGTIIRVRRAGFRYGDKIVRAPHVFVKM